MKPEIIVALDFNEEETALNTVKLLLPQTKYFKVGLELFSVSCLEVVRKIRDLGGKVFLDLKYFDIPNTVCSAVREAIKSGAFMVNVHALGGRELLLRTSETVKETAYALGIEKPIVVAVTLLTSMDGSDLSILGIKESAESFVLKLSELAKNCGLDGVVCSAREVRKIKENFGKDFITVVPGIRPSWSQKNDQKRTATPEFAKESGADYLVIGRPITRSEKPLEVLSKIKKSLLT